MARQAADPGTRQPGPGDPPELVAAARPDAIVATGRSDYPNQVNNVLCFPFIFRGALDVSATTINEAMKIAAVEAIAVAGPDGGSRGGRRGLRRCRAGVRSRIHHPQAVRSAADPGDRARGGARRHGQRAWRAGRSRDFMAYRSGLERFVFRSGQLMRPVFEAAKHAIHARSSMREGEDERVLRAAQTLVDEGIARPILLGRRAVIERQGQAKWGCGMDLAGGVRVLDPAQDDDVFGPLVPDYQRMVGPPRHTAGAGGRTPGRRRARSLRRCCCMPAWPTRRSAAAPAIGGGRCQYILPIIPRRPGRHARLRRCPA